MLNSLEGGRVHFSLKLSLRPVSSFSSSSSRWLVCGKKEQRSLEQQPPRIPHCLTSYSPPMKRLALCKGQLESVCVCKWGGGGLGGGCMCMCMCVHAHMHAQAHLLTSSRIALFLVANSGISLISSSNLASPPCSFTALLFSRMDSGTASSPVSSMQAGRFHSARAL